MRQCHKCVFAYFTLGFLIIANSILHASGQLIESDDLNNPAFRLLDSPPIDQLTPQSDTSSANVQSNGPTLQAVVPRGNARQTMPFSFITAPLNDGRTNILIPLSSELDDKSGLIYLNDRRLGGQTFATQLRNPTRLESSPRTASVRPTRGASQSVSSNRDNLLFLSPLAANNHQQTGNPLQQPPNTVANQPRRHVKAKLVSGKRMPFNPFNIVVPIVPPTPKRSTLLPRTTTESEIGVNFDDVTTRAPQQRFTFRIQSGAPKTTFKLSLPEYGIDKERDNGIENFSTTTTSVPQNARHIATVTFKIEPRISETTTTTTEEPIVTSRPVPSRRPVASRVVVVRPKTTPRPTITTTTSPFSVPFRPSRSALPLIQNVTKKADKTEVIIKPRVPKAPKIPGNFGMLTSRRELNLTQTVPGHAGSDYPVYDRIPTTSFECREMEYPGFYADMEAGCQIYHSCHGNRHARHSFMCPNGTIFSQEYLICDWWFNVDCDRTPKYYAINKAAFSTILEKKEKPKDKITTNKATV